MEWLSNGVHVHPTWGCLVGWCWCVGGGEGNATYIGLVVGIGCALGLGGEILKFGVPKGNAPFKGSIGELSQ
jgi:hypothetical protein